MFNKLLHFSLVIVLITLAGCSAFKSNKGTDGDGSLSEADLAAEREARYGSGSIPRAQGEGIFRDINFDYDSSTVSDIARQDIEYNYQVLSEHPGLRIQLEGHTDERGTADYNMALGEKRARAVQEVLVSLGVSNSRIDTISYGEEVPLDTEHNEAAYSRNRRVHFAGPEISDNKR